MYTGSVDEHNLPARFFLLLGNLHNPQDAVARGLRLGTDNGQPFTHERVQQCGLAGVGTAKNANESGMKGHRSRLLAASFKSVAFVWARLPRFELVPLAAQLTL